MVLKLGGYSTPTYRTSATQRTRSRSTSSALSNLRLNRPQTVAKPPVSSSALNSAATANATKIAAASTAQRLLTSFKATSALFQSDFVKTISGFPKAQQETVNAAMAAIQSAVLQIEQAYGAAYESWNSTSGGASATSSPSPTAPLSDTETSPQPEAEDAASPMASDDADLIPSGPLSLDADELQSAEADMDDANQSIEGAALNSGLTGYRAASMLSEDELASPAIDKIEIEA